ncbi:hypothetical protein IMX26_11595 [Clostridium sp. 'deep sea']|uniref:hypothetical protein n=1 Tax=Clostridium sp. 'deep sea' TaxID=2779445 RepID=UPI001896665E|nr:hypothetical protein [Clostridium sp. 'deep sea']QOR34133.1 hypothetical protein IMX26_11595 [Clostridium sp. 'deep sea']
MPIAVVKTINNLRLINRNRKLSYPGDVYVKVGDKVKADTIIARTEVDFAAARSIKVASYFGVPNDKIERILNVKEGDMVSKGDEIATLKKGFFSKRQNLTSPFNGVVEHISLSRGEIIIRERFSADESVVEIDVATKLNISPFFLKTFMHVIEGQSVTYNQTIASLDGFASGAILSPARGTIERIDTRKGKVFIRRPYSPVNLFGYISGEVKEVTPQYGAIIETPACYIEGVFGVGNETYGELEIVVKSPADKITADMLKDSHSDKILVGGSGITYDALQKAVELHVRGIIIGGLNNYDVVKLVGHEISVGITGQEEDDITLIATEGFGDVPMLPRTFELLKKHVGKTTSLNGTTQIRAGVIRPEIIIPLDAQVTEDPEGEDTLMEPQKGMKVRVISDPFYGMWGEVIKDGSETIAMENGTKQNVVHVKLESGKVIQIGENNIIVYEV